jgi:hypothetical protein
MKKLDVSTISTSIAMPIKSGTLTHVQQAYQEALAEIAKAITGSYSSSAVYVLNGLVRTGSGLVFNITAGSVFYNGEVYLVDAVSFTASGGNTAVGNIVTTFVPAVNADPVEFSDGVSRNVHQVRKIVISSGLAGSGVGDFLSFSRLNLNIAQVNITGTGIASVSGTYPNKVINVPAPPASPIVRKGVASIGDIDPSGGTTVNITFTDLGTNAYIVLGSIESNGTVANDAQVTWCIKNKANANFDVHFQEQQAVVQDINFAYAIILL